MKKKLIVIICITLITITALAFFLKWKNLPIVIGEEEQPVIEGGEVMLETMIDNIREESRNKGIEEGIEKVAKNLLKSNILVEVIAQSTGLSIEEIEELKKTI